MSEPTGPTPNPYAHQPAGPTPQPGSGWQAPYPYVQQPPGQPAYPYPGYPGYPQPGYPGYATGPRGDGPVAPNPFGPAALAVAIVAFVASVLSAAAVGLWTIVAIAVALAAIGLGIAGVARAGAKGLATAGIAIGVVALLIAGTLGVVAAADVDDSTGPVAVIEPGAGDDPATGALDGVAAPQGALANGGIPVGTAGVAGAAVPADAVVVDVYLDYMCPACAQFEATNAASLADLRASGTVVVVYHPVSILDRRSMGTAYSTRAATAAALVADQAPEAFAAFSAAMFAAQPGENTEGLTDTAIAQVATTAGVPEAVTAAIASGAYLRDGPAFAPWVTAATEQARTDLDELSTPTVLIDGVPFTGEWWVPGVLGDAVIDARD